MPVGNDFTLSRTGRGLAASRRPFGDARLPVRHSAARAEVPPRHQATQPRNEVSTLSGDLTTLGIGNTGNIGTFPAFFEAEKNDGRNDAKGYVP